MEIDARIPLYYQLMQDLIKKIETGFYKEGERLPSERELCQLYKMSRITVRQALQEMESEGYIIKQQGKGTFVSLKKYDQHLEGLYSFTEEMKKIGKIPNSEIISFQKIIDYKKMQTKMKSKGADFYQVVRLRLADDEPLMYETTYLPCEYFPGLTEELLATRPMYDVLREKYKILPTRATEQFSATLIREEEAEHLKVNIKQPAMLIKRTTYAETQMVEYTTSVVHGSKFSYTVELT